VHIGTVVAVAETGAHFLIKMPTGSKYKQRQIGINAIIRILPMSFKLTPIEYKPEQRTSKNLIGYEK